MALGLKKCKLGPDVENKQGKGCKSCFQEAGNDSHHFKSSILFLAEIVLCEKYTIAISIIKWGFFFDKYIDVADCIELYLSVTSQEIGKKKNQKTKNTLSFSKNK